VRLFCLDLEGVLIPEVWIGLAERTGIEALRATTRDIPDYDVLMRQRLGVLAAHGLGMDDIRAVVAGMEPLAGAPDFLDRLRQRGPVIILSDTFYEFAAPLMRPLGWPALFCHSLKIDEADRISDYVLRHADHKRAGVLAFMDLNFHVTAIGDSYNDTAMLGAADAGILFRAPQTVRDEFPQFPTAEDYAGLERAILDCG
jgi:phosphoserine/homoserine phosphotransferase